MNVLKLPQDLLKCPGAERTKLLAGRQPEGRFAVPCGPKGRIARYLHKSKFATRIGAEAPMYSIAGVPPSYHVMLKFNRACGSSVSSYDAWARCLCLNRVFAPGSSVALLAVSSNIVISFKSNQSFALAQAALSDCQKKAHKTQPFACHLDAVSLTALHNMLIYGLQFTATCMQ